MDNILQTALAEAVNSLASFFGTTTEAIMAHAPEFLAKYGWYSTLNGLPLTIIGAVLTFAVIFIFGTIVLGIFGVDLDHPLLTIIIVFILCLVVSVGIDIITCAVAPEIVGAHAVMELLKSMK